MCGEAAGRGRSGLGFPWRKRRGLGHHGTGKVVPGSVRKSSQDGERWVTRKGRRGMGVGEGVVDNAKKAPHVLKHEVTKAPRESPQTCLDNEIP